VYNISCKNKAVLNSENHIKLANGNIEISNSEKLLCVHIDDKLTWHIHVENKLKNAIPCSICLAGLNIISLFLCKN
jgi:hypothetical protein